VAVDAPLVVIQFAAQVQRQRTIDRMLACQVDFDAHALRMSDRRAADTANDHHVAVVHCLKLAAMVAVMVTVIAAVIVVMVVIMVVVQVYIMLLPMSFLETYFAGSFFAIFNGNDNDFRRTTEMSADGLFILCYKCDLHTEYSLADRFDKPEL
jgi:hypothetical protein